MPHRPAHQSKVLAQAAEWFAVLNSGVATSSEQQQWQAWLAQHPEHREAWAKVKFFTDKFHGLPSNASRVLKQPNQNRRQLLKTLAIFAGVGLSGFELWRRDDWRNWFADYRTGIGETKTITLADGSTVKLDAVTSLDVKFSPELRQLQLRTGSIYIETAPDPSGWQRPLVVDSMQGRVRAIGTRFAVSSHDTESQAIVYAGSVEVTTRASNPQRLKAGQQTHFTQQSIDAPQNHSNQQPAWTQGLLLADNQTLAEFILQLNRYRHGYITCDPSIAELRIVGTYPIHDTDRVLAVLEQTLPIKITKRSDWWVRIEPRS